MFSQGSVNDLYAHPSPLGLLVTAVPRWRHDELPGQILTTEKAVEAQKERGEEGISNGMAE